MAQLSLSMHKFMRNYLKKIVYLCMPFMLNMGFVSNQGQVTLDDHSHNTIFMSPRDFKEEFSILMVLGG